MLLGMRQRCVPLMDWLRTHLPRCHMFRKVRPTCCFRECLAKWVVDSSSETRAQRSSYVVCEGSAILG